MTAPASEQPAELERAAAVRARLVALTVAAAFFMQALDTTIISTAMPAMARSFHVLPANLSVGVSSYLLALAAFLPISGWVADRFGPRNVFGSAIVVFTIASVLCSQTHDLWTFTAARLLQGAGGALMVPVGRMVVLRAAEKKNLLNAIAMITWPGLMAPVIGPALGGYIIKFAAWPWIFLVNLPLGIIGLGLVAAFVPNDRGGERRPFDALGFLMSSGSLLMIVGGLEFISHSPTPWPPLALTVAGLALGAVCVRRFQTSPRPFIDLEALKVPTFAITTLWGGSIQRMVVQVTPFLLPLMFQVGFGYTALHSGLMILAYFAGNLAMKSVTTPLLRHFGFRTVLVCNGVICGLTVVVCGFFSPRTAEALMLAILVVAGLSRSMQFTALNSLTFADVTPQQRTGAATLSGVANQLAGVFGIALGTLLLNAFVGLRGAHQAGLPDFQRTFLVLGALSILSVGSLLRLDRNAGAEVAGKAP